MKRLALIFILGAASFLGAQADPNPVDVLFQQAQAANTAKNYDGAIQLYEKVITDHPEASNRWYEAQMNITVMLTKKGDFASAAQAVHLCLDGAPDEGAYDGAVGFAANILSAQDKNVDRANQFLTFQQKGPAGGANPMDAVGYPSNPAREAAFATIRQQAGDDANAAHVRALTYLFTGKPKEALAQFADAFRRYEFNYNWQNTGIDLVCMGLRDVRGHRVGLDKDLQFVIYGPAGPDGKLGTPDDLPDPFAALLPDTPPPGQGGVAGLSADDLAALRQVQIAAQLYGLDPVLPGDIRGRGLLTLQRVNDALDAWGAPGQKDRYISQIFDLVGPAPDEGICNLLLTGAESAARGRGLNYGGLLALWDEIDARCAAVHVTRTRGMIQIHDQFDAYHKVLLSIKFQPINPNQLKTPATNF